MYGCRLPANEQRNKNVLQGSLPLAFFPQVLLLLSAQQVLKWKTRELQKWRSLTKVKVSLCAPWGCYISQILGCWEEGLELTPVWADASVLAFPCLHSIKSKAENKPSLDGFDGSWAYLQILLKHAPSKRCNYQDIEIKLLQSCTELLSSHSEAKQRKSGITKLEFIIKANEAILLLLGAAEASCPLGNLK